MREAHIKPFLKWPGRKYNILNILLNYIEPFNYCDTLIEPFVGSGAVFMNTNFKKYILNDSNQDLINLYNYLISDSEKFIKLCFNYFGSEFNNPEKYYDLRDKFNNINNTVEKSAIFLYLNLHGYNGLCRYNNSGGYNVPFGRYAKISFPVKSLKLFCDKANIVKIKVTCEDFTDCFEKITSNSLVYCDPPYVPASASSSFTKYVKTDFDLNNQENLVKLVESAGLNKISTIISNHDLPFTRELYKNSKIISFDVRRSISCKVNNRNLVKELLAIYDYKKL